MISGENEQGEKKNREKQKTAWDPAPQRCKLWWGHMEQDSYRGRPTTQRTATPVTAFQETKGTSLQEDVLTAPISLYCFLFPENAVPREN